MVRLGRMDQARSLLEAERASLGGEGEALAQRLAAPASSPAAEPVQIDEPIAALAKGDAAGALPAFERAIEAAPDDVRALVGAGQALRALGRASEAQERLDRALDGLERRKGALAEPVVLRAGSTSWNGTSTLVLPSGKEEPFFWSKAIGWQPVRALSKGTVSRSGTIATFRQGQVTFLVDARRQADAELGTFDWVMPSDEGKYLLGCTDERAFVFDSSGRKLAERKQPCGELRPRVVGELLFDARQRVVVSRLPSLDVVLDAEAHAPKIFEAQRMALVVGKGKAPAGRLLDLRTGRVAATVKGRKLNSSDFALSPDGKRMLYLEGRELRAVDVEAGREDFVGKLEPAMGTPVGQSGWEDFGVQGYLPDGRMCVRLFDGAAAQVVESHALPFPRRALPKGSAERCFVHEDGSATAVIVPASSRFVPRSESMGTALNEAVSRDRTLAAFVEASGDKSKPRYSVVVLGTGAEQLRVVRVLSGDDIGSSAYLRFSLDGKTLLVSGDGHDLSSGAKGPPLADHLTWREWTPRAFEDTQPDGPVVAAAPASEAPATSQVEPAKDVAWESLLDPTSKGGGGKTVAVAYPLTVTRDRRGVVRWTTGDRLVVSLVGVDGGKRHLAFLPDRRVELLEGGEPPAELYCRVGDVVTPFDVCRESAWATGEVHRLLTSPLSAH